MKYLQRLSGNLIHYDSLTYLIHNKKKYIIDYRIKVKYSDTEYLSMLDAYGYIVLYKNYKLIDIMYPILKYCLLLNIMKYHGSIRCLKLFRALGIERLPIVMTCASNGHSRCLKLLHKWGVPVNNCAMEAAANGYPNCMKLLHKWQPDSSFWYVKNIRHKNSKCLELLKKWGISLIDVAVLKFCLGQYP